jgi:hypothetical protein
MYANRTNLKLLPFFLAILTPVAIYTARLCVNRGLPWLAFWGISMLCIPLVTLAYFSRPLSTKTRHQPLGKGAGDSSARGGTDADVKKLVQLDEYKAAIELYTSIHDVPKNAAKDAIARLQDEVLLDQDVSLKNFRRSTCLQSFLFWVMTFNMIRTAYVDYLKGEEIGHAYFALGYCIFALLYFVIALGFAERFDTASRVSLLRSTGKLPAKGKETAADVNRLLDEGQTRMAAYIQRSLPNTSLNVG